MLITSAEANKILKFTQNEIARLKNQHRTSYQFTAAVSEDIEYARPDYNYTKVRDEIGRLEEKVRKIKHALNIFNSTTKLPYGLTIDEALILLPQLTDKKDLLSNMRRCKDKERLSVYGSKDIEYRYINFIPSEVEQDYLTVCEAISNLQRELDITNNTIEFEVEE